MSFWSRYCCKTVQTKTTKRVKSIGEQQLQNRNDRSSYRILISTQRIGHHNLIASHDEPRDCGNNQKGSEYYEQETDTTATPDRESQESSVWNQQSSVVMLLIYLHLTFKPIGEGSSSENCQRGHGFADKITESKHPALEVLRDFFTPKDPRCGANDRLTKTVEKPE